MTTAKMSEALRAIDNAGLERPYLDKKFSVLPAQIEEAESILGYKFPASYKDFLGSLGSGDFQGAEFYGLIPNRLDMDEIPNALWFTQDLRENMGFPEELFAFQDFDGDAVACLALADMTDSECPVVLWDHSEDAESQLKNPYILADSFGEYFYNKIQEMIEDMKAS